MAERGAEPQGASDAATLEVAEAALQKLESSLASLEAAVAEEKRRRAYYEGLLRAKSSASATYADLLAVTRTVVQRVKEGGRGFVSQRGERGYHILFDESEMSRYFDEIREGLGVGPPSPRDITPTSSNREIWEALVQSLEFSGVDFEHMYKIVPADSAEQVGTRNTRCYSFAESIVLSHTLLLVPVMQHYAPLMPKLDLKGPTKRLDRAQPLLAVGMVGDCVRGSFFEEIKGKAEQGDAVAVKQRDTLLHPGRLQQKLRGLVRTLLEACKQQPQQPQQDRQRRLRLHIDAVLVGTGAFGGDPKVLAQPFVDSLGGGGLPFAGGDDVSFFVFPPPAPEHLSLGPSLGYTANLNPKRGLGAAFSPTPEEEGAADGGGGGSSVVRVLVAGFDPVSIAPHGVVYRTFSAEGQLCHTTDILERLSGVRGEFVPVRVPQGQAWESPAAFFAKPQVLKTKDEEGYDTVRFVPRGVLEELGFEEGQELEIRERGAARVWNGDSFEGWTLQLAGGPRGRSWQDVLRS